MNSMQLKDKLKNIAVKRNLNFNTLLRLYMYDRFIERLAVSKYRDNFILKDSKIIKSRWNSYKIKYEYANDIDYDEIMQCIEEIVRAIVPVAKAI